MAQLKVKKNEEITGNLDPKYWVQKSDPLLLMRSVPFSLGELKILDTYISRINAADDAHRTVIFTKEEYEELMGLTAANYRALEKNTEGLLGKIVTLEMPDKAFLKFVLFSKAYYHKDEYGKPIIEITCTEEAKDLFFCIGKYHYLSYALENVIKLTHKASYLLYLYIRHNRHRGEWDIDLDELRDSVLDCKEQESYQEYKIFKNRVLDPAVKEVNKKTDCHFAYEAIKRGRRVAKIKFIYQSQDLMGEQLELSEFTEEEPAFDVSQSEAERHELYRDALAPYAITDEQIDELVQLARKHIDARSHFTGSSLDQQIYNYLLSAKRHAKINARSEIKNIYRYLLPIIKNNDIGW